MIDEAKSVRELYKFAPFPGRFVHVLDMRKSLKKTLLLIALRRIVFSQKNISKCKEKYRSLTGEPSKILDPACGTGDHICLIALAFPDARVFAGDFTDEHLRYAERLADALGIRNITFFSSDITQPGLKMTTQGSTPKNFELITCNGVIHHLKDPAAGIQNVSQLLAPHGTLYMSVYGTSFYREEYINRTLIQFFGQFDFPEKLKLLEDLGINRQFGFLTPSRINLFKMYAGMLLGKGIGIYLFPKPRNSNQMDGFWHPSNQFFDPDTMFHYIENAGMTVEGVDGLSIPPAWKENRHFKNLSFKDQFQLLDACFEISYNMICKFKLNQKKDSNIPGPI